MPCHHRRCLLPALLLAGLVLCLASCASPLSRGGEERILHALTADRAAHLSALAVSQPLARALKVRPFRVSPAFSGSDFIYRVGTDEFQTDYYNRYLTNPDAQITHAARTWLAESGIFKHVALTSTDMAADYFLESAVNAFYGDFTTTPPVAVLNAQCFLLNDTGREHEVVLSKTFTVQTPLQTTSPAGLAQAQNAALADFLGQLEEALKAVLE